MRIGANSGSLPKHLADARPAATRPRRSSRPRSRRCELLEKLDFHDFKISVKSSHVPTMIRAYRMLSDEGAVPAAPRRDRGGDAVLRLDQERGRHGRAARRRDRRHDARLAHRRPGRGGQDRVRDPEGARPARARADHDRLPVVRPRQRRRRDARRARSRSGCATYSAALRGRRARLRRERAGGGGRRRLRHRRRPRRRLRLRARPRAEEGLVGHPDRRALPRDRPVDRRRACTARSG